MGQARRTATGVRLRIYRYSELQMAWISFEPPHNIQVSAFTAINLSLIITACISLGAILHTPSAHCLVLTVLRPDHYTPILHAKVHCHRHLPATYSVLLAALCPQCLRCVSVQTREDANLQHTC